MTDGDIRIVAPDAKVHHDGVLDLAAKVHGNYFNFLNVCRGGYIDHSHFDWSASRIALAGEQVVCFFAVWKYAMRIGRCSVRTGGIGAVATHVDFRKRGLMGQTARASIQAMRDLGYGMTVLFGIRDFYEKLGYVQAFPDQTWFVAAGELPAAKGLGLVRYRAGSRKDLDALYNRWHQGLTGTAVRPTYTRARPEAGNAQWQGWQWKDARGKTTGYVVVLARGTTLDVGDAAGEPGAILAALGRLAAKLRCIEVRFGGLHEQSELARAIRRLNSRCETRHFRSGGAMASTISLPRVLGEIAPELSRRLSDSTMRDWQGQLLIADAHDRAMLQIAQGQVRLADTKAKARAANFIVGGDEMARLLLGIDDPLQVAREGKIRMSGQGKDLLRALFPAQHPNLYSWDRY